MLCYICALSPVAMQCLINVLRLTNTAISYLYTRAAVFWGRGEVTPQPWHSSIVQATQWPQHCSAAIHFFNNHIFLSNFGYLLVPGGGGVMMIPTFA